MESNCFKHTFDHHLTISNLASTAAVSGQSRSSWSGAEGGFSCAVCSLSGAKRAEGEGLSWLARGKYQGRGSLIVRTELELELELGHEQSAA